MVSGLSMRIMSAARIKHRQRMNVRVISSEVERSLFRSAPSRLRFLDPFGFARRRCQGRLVARNDDGHPRVVREYSELNVLRSDFGHTPLATRKLESRGAFCVVRRRSTPIVPGVDYCMCCPFTRELLFHRECQFDVSCSIVLTFGVHGWYRLHKFTTTWRCCHMGLHGESNHIRDFLMRGI